MSQPDILFIVTDTQRRDRLSLYGGPTQLSPYLDQFAANATVFERAISPAQWTIPAHASMFTGQYPHLHGLTQAFQRMPTDTTLLAETLRAHGYRTMAFCNNPLLGLLDHDLQRGIDEFYNYAGMTPTRPRSVRAPRVQRQLQGSLRTVARLIQNQVAQQEWVFRFSMQPWFVSIWTKYLNFKGNTALSLQDFLTVYDAHHAGGAGQPVFAYINLMGTHTPYQPEQADLQAVDSEIARDRQAADFIAHHNRDCLEWLSPTAEPLEEWQRATLLAYYDAEVRRQDRELGRFFEHVARSGRLDETVVVVVADHGEGLGDHGYIGHSFLVHQELVDVPFIIRYPAAFETGTRIPTNVSTRRLYHTLLDLADALPPEHADAIQRLSLAQNIDAEDDLAFAEAVPPQTLVNTIARSNPALLARCALDETRRSVTQGDYKLTMVGERVEGLYHIADDPQELDNLADVERQTRDLLLREIQQFLHPTHPAPHNPTGITPEIRAQMRALGYMD